MNHPASKMAQVVLASFMAIAGYQSKQGEIKDVSQRAVEINTQQADGKPKWSAACSLPEAALTVEFNSPSGDVTEDDMTVTVRWSDGSSTPIPAAPGWFTEAMNVTWEAENVCTGIVGNALPGKRLLLWFFRNDRPDRDQLQLALLSVADKRVLDIKADIGEIAIDPIMINRGSGFSVQLLKESRQNGPGGGEFGVPEWKDIIIKEDHIIAVWHCDTGNPKPAKKASKKNGGSGSR